MATLTKEPKIEKRALGERAHSWEVKKSRRNVGGFERGARLIAGAACAGAAVYSGSAWLAAGLGAIGADGLITGVAGYSPFNGFIGRDSYHQHKMTM